MRNLCMYIMLPNFEVHSKWFEGPKKKKINLRFFENNLNFKEPFYFKFLGVPVRFKDPKYEIVVH